MNQLYQWLGERKSRRIRLALMDMWKPFRTAAQLHAPATVILFEKFHVMRHLSDALDAVRQAEYARLSGKDRRFIKGQKYWSYDREGWARRFFDNWRAALKMAGLKPYEKLAEMFDHHWAGIAAYYKPDNKVSLGFVEGLHNKIRVIQRRSYGLRDEEYLRLKILTSMLPAL